MSGDGNNVGWQVHASGDGDKGVAHCPFSFYKTWVENPLLAQAQV